MAGSLALSMCENPWTYGPCGQALLTPGSPWRSVDGHATLDSTNLRRPGGRSPGASSWPTTRAPAAGGWRGTGRRRRRASVAVSRRRPDGRRRLGLAAAADRDGDGPAAGAGGRGAGAAEVAERRARRRREDLWGALRDGHARGRPGVPAPGAASRPCRRTWSSPARAPTWTSAARSCRWTRRRPCGCAGSPACVGRTCSSPTSTGFAELHRPGPAAVRRCRSSAGSTAPCASPSGRTSRCTSPRVPSRAVRAVAVDDSGRLVLDGPAGRQAHAAGDVVHVRPPG